MTSVIEQLQELVVKLEKLGETMIATYEKAQAEGMELAPDLLHTRGKAYGLAQAYPERAKEQRTTQD
jgi:hypothetical protein